MFVASRQAARPRTRRRRRLSLESLARRELLAVGDFCTAGTPEAPAGQIGSIGIDAIPTVSIADASVVEGDAGASVMSFEVTLSEAPTDGPVTVVVTTANDTATALRVDRVASGLSRPIFATAPVGDLDRLFVVEQRGDIEILQLSTGQVNSTPFLSISGLATGNEQGLLGLAFHPDYANNGLFYINVTVSGGDTQIREYQVSAADPDVADPDSVRTLLTYDQPFSNHNGGWMGFGPDGYLYISSGDGGSGNDPGNRAQDITDQLLGKMLRIDVNGDDFPGDGNRNYSIPASNPFVGVTGDDEIWAYGLRNPWRSSFDRATGDLYIGDVGQGSREEIDVQLAASAGGENYGWRLREGTIQTPASGVGGPKPAGAIDPIYDYTHNTSSSTGGISVTGGYVYRGPIEELQGNYFFADYLGRVWSLRFNGDDPSQHDGTNYTDFVEWNPLLNPTAGTIGQIPSFAEDAAGNLYILDLGGEIFTISEGADYLPNTETLTFDVGGSLTQTFEVEVLGDRLAEIAETFSVTLSNVSGGTPGDIEAVGTIQNNDPPSVASIVINDGGPTRSQITSLAVTFDTEVNLTGSALVLTNLDTQAVLTTVQTSISVAGGRTAAVLTFGDGTSVAERDGVGELANSLADGRYRLDVIASEVSTASGAIAMASNVSFGDQVTDDFFRLYGDDDGNGVVNLFDFAAFRATFGLGPLDPGFNAALDDDGNGLINLFDFAAFRANFGTAI